MIDERLLEIRDKYGRRRTGTDDQDVEDIEEHDDDEYDDDDEEYDEELDDEEDDFVPQYVRPVDMSKVSVKNFKRIKTGWPAFDDFIGGGLIPGFIYLLGGDAGAGKSTLCLQIGHAIRAVTHYVSAEEDKNAIKRRMTRVRPTNDIKFVRTKDIETALNIKSYKPTLLVLDSLQKFRHRGRYGSHAAVRAMNEIETYTRKSNCITIVLSRATKKSEFAGRNDLDHDSDATLYLGAPGKKNEHGDQNDPRRYLKVNKNREGHSPRMMTCRMEKHGIVFDDLLASKPMPEREPREPTLDEPTASKPTTSKPTTRKRTPPRSPKSTSKPANKPSSKPANKPATREHLDKTSRNSSKCSPKHTGQARGKSVNSEQVKQRARAASKG